jgi:hypothetical protein
MAPSKRLRGSRVAKAVRKRPEGSFSPRSWSRTILNWIALPLKPLAHSAASMLSLAWFKSSKLITDFFGKSVVVVPPRVSLTHKDRIRLLPFDTINIVCSFLTVRDLVSLKSCSRDMYKSVSKHACLFYGNLIRDRFQNSTTVGTIYGRAQYSLRRQNDDCLPLLYAMIDSGIGDLMTRQSCDVNMATVLRNHSFEALGPEDYIDESMLACVNDWLTEVSVEYKFRGAILHEAVQRLDSYMANHIVTRPRLQLYGCCCLMAASTWGDEVMQELTPHHVMFLCDQQYDLEDVLDALQNIHVDTWCQPNHSFYKFTVLYHLKFLLEACELPIELLYDKPVISSLYNISMQDYDALQSNAIENVILCLLLADLTLLDSYMQDYSQITTAASILYFSRILMHFYSKPGVFISSNGIMECGNRELRKLR